MSLPAEPLEQLHALVERMMPDTSVDLRPLEALTGPCRMIVPDPGNPGGIGPWGEVLWPPDFRLETDAELRVRIKATLDIAA